MRYLLGACVKANEVETWFRDRLHLGSLWPDTSRPTSRATTERRELLELANSRAITVLLGGEKVESAGGAESAHTIAGERGTRQVRPRPSGSPGWLQERASTACPSRSPLSAGTRLSRCTPRYETRTGFPSVASDPDPRCRSTLARLPPWRRLPLAGERKRGSSYRIFARRTLQVKDAQSE
jgi:hypothetical protein